MRKSKSGRAAPIGGPELRRLRLALGLKQWDLARFAKVGQVTISRIETGDGYVSADTMRRVVAALVTADEAQRRRGGR